MTEDLSIRPFKDGDKLSVRNLFIQINRLIAPKGMEQQFEDYIERSLAEEIDCIPEYYKQHHGSFWITEQNGMLKGMFGLEKWGDDGMELRRMYVDPDTRRQGIAGRMLSFAENHCRKNSIKQLHLSTSELQPAALSLYKNAGYPITHEEQADTASNKTIGGGIRRYYFTKTL